MNAYMFMYHIILMMLKIYEILVSNKQEWNFSDSPVITFQYNFEKMEVLTLNKLNRYSDTIIYEIRKRL